MISRDTAVTGELFALEPENPEPETGPRATIAVAAPVDDLLHYRVPPFLVGRLRAGQQVRVPLGPRKVSGFVVALEEKPPAERGLKLIVRIEDEIPLLTKTTLALGLWVARYYGTPPGEALRAVVPAPVRHQRRGRLEVLVTLRDPEQARRIVEERAQTRSWASRVKVLRHLLREESPLPMRQLTRHAQVSTSPVFTLDRQGILQLERRAVSIPELAGTQPQRAAPPTLTKHQARALEGLLPLLEQERSATALLHGVTGSGKTEVYLRLIEATLARGRGAILLVPEIALTPQTVERLRARLPEVAVLHSGLSSGDRAHQWRRLRDGEVRVAVGPRSAVFAPMPSVGLIVIDEEHENTFKQNQAPRYHARDVARRRAELEGALLLMGTATPSMEVEAGCRRGDVLRFRLPERVLSRPLPRCTVIDMRQEKPAMSGHLFSRPLLLAIEQTLHENDQVLLFLNRRGFATSVLCRRCGWKSACPHCDIHLTHYRESDRLLCHYCAYEVQPPRECPDCLTPGILFEGVGTERVAEGVKRLFPGVRVERMDGETLRRRGAAERIYQDLKSGAIDVLVGTQVVAKGLDIPGIALVGVVSADTALLVPDFRSAERTWQLLCQVAGRAGRGDKPGKVLVQTWSPEHYAIRAAATNDQDAFDEEELRHRKALDYPPFGSLLRVVLEGLKSEAVAQAAAYIRQHLEALPGVKDGSVRILGPAPCPIGIIRNHHRRHLLLISKRSETLTSVLASVPRRVSAGVRILLDRDPVSLM